MKKSDWRRFGLPIQDVRDAIASLMEKSKECMNHQVTKKEEKS